MLELRASVKHVGLGWSVVRTVVDNDIVESGHAKEKLYDRYDANVAIGFDQSIGS